MAACERANADFVLRDAALETHDVVPRPHRITAIQRDRSHRRIRKHEAEGPLTGTYELGNDRLEIVAVGTETVHPDDGADRIRAGLDFDDFE